MAAQGQRRLQGWPPRVIDRTIRIFDHDRPTRENLVESQTCLAARACLRTFSPMVDEDMIDSNRGVPGFPREKGTCD